jgi:hypothetical protein
VEAVRQRAAQQTPTREKLLTLVPAASEGADFQSSVAALWEAAVNGGLIDNATDGTP